ATPQDMTRLIASTCPCMRHKSRRSFRSRAFIWTPGTVSSSFGGDETAVYDVVPRTRFWRLLFRQSYAHTREATPTVKDVANFSPRRSAGGFHFEWTQLRQASPQYRNSAHDALKMGTSHSERSIFERRIAIVACVSAISSKKCLSHRQPL